MKAETEQKRKKRKVEREKLLNNIHSKALNCTKGFRALAVNKKCMYLHIVVTRISLEIEGNALKQF